MIKVDELNFSFDKQIVFSDASFSLNSNGVYVLQGENGSGKTTLLKLLLGYFLPQDGNIQIDGININKNSLKQDIMLVRDNVSYLSQDSDFISFLNAQENASIFNILNQGKLDDLKLLNHDKFKNRKSNELSSGEKVLISFERLINENKKIILLDECSDFLDDKNTKTIISKVKELGKTKLVIIVSHDPRIIKCFKQYIRIENNQIISSFDDNISSEICENVKTKSTRKKLFYPSLRLIKNSKIYILLLTLLMLIFNAFYFCGSNYITYPKKDFFKLTITPGSYLLSKEKETNSVKINDMEIDISLKIQPHNLTKEDNKLIADHFNVEYYDSMYFKRIKIGKGDGFFHIPKDQYEILSNRGSIKNGIYYYYSLFKIPCVKDKSISESYIYQDDIYENIEYVDSLKLNGVLWENSLISYSSKEGLTKLLNEYGKISFVSPSILEQKYQVSLNKEIKNNELYYSSFLQEYYTNQVLTFMDYSKVDLKQYFTTFCNLSDVFVSAHLVKDENIQKYLKSNEVLISEECFNKIISKIDYKKSPIIEVNEKNKKDFIDFYNKNNYRPNDKDFYKEISQSYSSFSYDYETYAMYYLIMLFLFLICECSLIYIFINTYYEKQKNNILVFSRYLKVKDTLIMFLTPIVLAIVFSFILGMGISIPILSNYYTSRKYFIPNVPINIFEILITFGFNLLVFGFTSLILLINIKKKKNK